MSAIANVNVDILRNRGIMVEVHRLAKDNEGNLVQPYERVMNSADEYVYENIFIRFDNWTIANIEDAPPSGFGSFENYQEAMQTSPARTVPQTVAHLHEKYLLDKDGARVPDLRYGAMLLKDGHMQEYMLACLNAMMLAQGIASPEALAESVNRQVTSLRKLQKEANAAFEKEKFEMDEEDEDGETSETTPTDRSDDTPSSTGTQDGVPSDDHSMSSGD